MSDRLEPPPLPTPEQFKKLVELRRTIIETIETVGVTRGTVAGDDNVVRMTRTEDPDVRGRAIGTAIHAVAACIGGDLSREQFLELAARAYQLQLDEDAGVDRDDDL
jgi:hypothetical protein